MKELTNTIGKDPLFRFSSENPLTSVEQKWSDSFYTHTENLQKKYSINNVLPTYYIKWSHEKLQNLENSCMKRGIVWQECIIGLITKNSIIILCLTVTVKSVLQSTTFWFMFTNIIIPVQLPIFLPFITFPITGYIHMCLKATPFFFFFRSS